MSITDEDCKSLCICACVRVCSESSIDNQTISGCVGIRTSLKHFSRTVFEDMKTVFHSENKNILQQQDNFVLIKGYTDFGTEVEYLYNPQSGEAKPLLWGPEPCGIKKLRRQEMDRDG